MNEDLTGLVAVITGGGSGIGAATAQALARRGATVTVIARTPPETDPPFPTYVADVTDGAAVSAAIDAIARDHGSIDILVNNAGVGAAGTVADNDADQWRQVLDVNVVGIARVTAAALPYLQQSPSAAIVNTCSIAAHVGLPQRALYSASKGAVLALTRAMAADHVGEGIRVNCVSPGTVNTPWVQRLLEAAEDPAAELARLSARQPTGRLVEPEEVAQAIAYLAAPASGWVTGTALSVDGGMRELRMPS